MRKALILLMLVAGLYVEGAWAFEPFVIKDIRVEGLQRIEVGTVFNYLPIAAGDTLNDQRAAEAIRALFKTGFFSDVSLEHKGNELVVKVVERPSISKVNISGNKDIKTEDLTTGLKRIGLAEGRVFDRSMLEQVKRELERQYFARGKYGVKITSEVKPQDRNRVEVNLKIDEGKVAKIQRITLVGNHAFSEETLLSNFQLGPPALFSVFTENDQYSKQKLAADLETLRSYYLDRGYIDFSIDSTQVAITPDKKDVYITINITEGNQFTVSDVKLAGDLKLPEAELAALISIKPGEIFSRKQVTESSARINDRLGKEGYAFANINPTPVLDREKRTVKLTFFVDPGKRVYVRRINISGNTRTRDVVLRREIRQLENGWISTDSVNRSRERLQKLGYFDQVNVETPAVPGTDDQVDVDFGVKERSSFGSLTAGVGFSQSQGLLLNASVNQENFMGTGKHVSAAINNSKVNTIYSFSYTNPYYTVDGVSRGFSLFLRTTDAAALTNVGSYTSDALGGSVNYGIPLSEFNTMRASIGYEQTHLKTNTLTPQNYLQFISANASDFGVFKLTLSWTHDTRNKAFFPDNGLLQSLSASAALPGSDLDYYKLSTQTTWYHPLLNIFTLSLNGEVDYGGTYGSTTGFPFFENYYAGGIHSVRGYRSNTLGPKENDQALGGALNTVGSAELFFTPPFMQENSSFRMGAFFDIGNVYKNYASFDAGELRYSTGVSAVWLSPIGPLTFSLAKALNAKPVDNTEIFQFSLGAVF
jgi:outer membrane protein insertion porin family